MDTQPHEDVKYDLNGTNMGLISIVTKVKLYDISTWVWLAVLNNLLKI